ncbi:MAG: right-handed parallel beta-helix repeat-containing protein [Tepidisphaeraceae bacterium]
MTSRRNKDVKGNAVKQWTRSALMAVVCFVAGPALASDAAKPSTGPVLDKPTLRSLGAYWIIKGDDNQNATVRIDYRTAGGGEWRQGPLLFRVEKGAHKPKENDSLLKLADDETLLSASVLLLDPDTAYELKLTLSDPDGGEATTKTLAARTVAEPVAPSGPMYYVIPGDGGGTGAKNDPYKGLAAAEKNARPGDTFLLAAGVYNGPVTLRKSGEPGKPIVFRGAGGGEAIIDGQGAAAERPGKAIEAVGLHDRWFEDLTIRNAKYAIVSHDTARLVLRRCRINGVDFGLTATKNEKDAINGYFITDNVMEGPSTWPRAKGIEDARGVQLTGSGHVIAYNRIRAFADAIDTMPSQRCESIDIHNNDVSEMTDDGIEADYAQRNVRVFHNRLTNVFQGISTQPVYGGPVYIFRNAMFNVSIEPFKMHNGPSGALFLHNTSVKAGPAHVVMTPKPMSNMVSRNNLFVGTTAKVPVDFSIPATACDFDYDGFAVNGSFSHFLNWNRGETYATFEEMRKRSPVWKNAVLVDGKTAFASGVTAPESDRKAIGIDATDVRLSPKSAAVDAGQVLPGVNDGFSGAAPDLGAYEVGAPLPHYGPRSKQQ